VSRMRSLVTGARGLLGSEIVRWLESTGDEVLAAGSSDLDIRDADAVTRTLAAFQPDRIFQCAAFTAVDDAEEQQSLAREVNRDGARNVAEAACDAGVRLVHFSTDFVFSGDASHPYPPDATPDPQSVYATSKLEGELAVQAAAGDLIVIRTSWLFGGGGRTFVGAITDRARQGHPLKVVDDQIGRPTWTRTVAHASEVLSRMDVQGVHHVADRGTATWLELAEYALSLQGIPVDIQGVSSAEWGAPAQRPAYSVLALEETEALLGARFRTWRETLKRFLEEDAR